MVKVMEELLLKVDESKEKALEIIKDLKDKINIAFKQNDFENLVLLSSEFSRVMDRAYYYNGWFY